jgi:hypothetical protein
MNPEHKKARELISGASVLMDGACEQIGWADQSGLDEIAFKKLLIARVMLDEGIRLIVAKEGVL